MTQFLTKEGSIIDHDQGIRYYIEIVILKKIKPLALKIWPQIFLKNRQFLLKLLFCSNLLNFAIWKKCALALNRADKIKHGQIKRSVFFSPGYQRINRNLQGGLGSIGCSVQEISHEFHWRRGSPPPPQVK